MDQLPTLANQASAPVQPVVTPAVTEQAKRPRGRPPKIRSEEACSVHAAKITGSCDPNSVLANVGEAFMQQELDNDVVSRDIVVNHGSIPTLSHISHFARQNWNCTLGSAYTPDRTRPSLKKEIGRMEQVVRDEQIAGRKADRAETEVELNRATAELAARGPELDEMIAKAEGEKRRLEKSKASAETRLHQANEAVERLRANIPPALAKLAAQSRMSIQETVGADFREIDAKRTELISLLNIDPEGESATHYKRRLGVNHPIRNCFDRQSYIRAWEAMKVEWLAELHAIEDSWQAAKKVLDDALEATREAEDFYVK